MTETARTFVENARQQIGAYVALRGWIYRLRVLSDTAFVVLRDCTGEVQCVAATARLRSLRLKKEDAVEIRGTVRADQRASGGVEVMVEEVLVLGAASRALPFNSSGDIKKVSLNAQLDYRPLSLRTTRLKDIFDVKNALLRSFRKFMEANHFTEIITSKLVGRGTEGGTNVFEVDYFGRQAFLAQSPQFYKEHGVVAFERVFETGHVYRAEPHASSRHLTEYYSLDFEVGFIDGPDDVIEIERKLLESMFLDLAKRHKEALERLDAWPLPDIAKAPIWTFDECLTRLANCHGLTHLTDDLDPNAERLLCALAEEETGVAAVFVLGFPLSGRPFYTLPRGKEGASQGFDLLLNGVEVTTGGQRHHDHDALRASMSSRSAGPSQFEDHLRMFQLGMPPHGGLAIGLERLTAQILHLRNIRETVMYPRDRNRFSP